MTIVTVVPPSWNSRDNCVGTTVSKGQSLLYENQVGKPMKLDELLVLSEVVNNKRVKVTDLANIPNMGSYRVQSVIERLCSLEFIEPSGKTSGLSYILHVSKLCLFAL